MTDSLDNAESESLRNGRNDCNPYTIKDYFLRYPNSTAKECCRALRLKYAKHGGRARKIKHDLNRFRQSIVSVTDQHGRPLKPLLGVHRQEYRFGSPVPVGYVAILKEKAQPCRVKGAWYRSHNRNGQLEYFDDYVSIRVYPKSGTCRILLRTSIMFDEFRVHVDNAFANALPAQCILSSSFKDMMDSLQVARQHRTFYIGPVTPFSIELYRDSHGIDILADRSHPEHLEVHESWPTWLSPMLESQRNQRLAIENNNRVISEFASQIEKHLDAMRGIGRAADRLNESICSLKAPIGRSHLNGVCVNGSSVCTKAAQDMKTCHDKK